jgi:hypothetical protein
MATCKAGCKCAECVYEFEERAAILEFDGGLPRAEAEREARAQIAKARAEARGRG